MELEAPTWTGVPRVPTLQRLRQERRRVPRTGGRCAGAIYISCSTGSVGFCWLGYQYSIPNSGLGGAYSTWCLWFLWHLRCVQGGQLPSTVPWVVPYFSISCVKMKTKRRSTVSTTSGMMFLVMRNALNYSLLNDYFLAQKELFGTRYIRHVNHGAIPFGQNPPKSAPKVCHRNTGKILRNTRGIWHVLALNPSNPIRFGPKNWLVFHCYDANLTPFGIPAPSCQMCIHPMCVGGGKELNNVLLSVLFVILVWNNSM